MAQAKDFQITQDEASRLKEAMKKPEFRKLLAEYAEEISDPENKKKYEEELIALEQQRGVDMKYIHPKPGFVMKSFLLPESTRKIFINVCHNEMIAAASCTPSEGKKKKKGQHWNVPYSLTPPRDDLDKSNNTCTVVDAVFNSETFQSGQSNLRFKQMLLDTVFDGLESQLSLKVDKTKVIFLRMPYKGKPVPAVIRRKMDTKPDEAPNTSGLKFPFPPLKEEQAAKSHKNQQRAKEKARLPSEPKHTLLHRGEFSMQDFTNQRESSHVKRPKELVLTVELPGVESASSVDLDIFEKRVVLKSEAPQYSLDLALPYPVDEEKGRAKFDKAKKVLTITLPVLPPPPTTTTPQQLHNQPERDIIAQEPEERSVGSEDCTQRTVGTIKENGQSLPGDEASSSNGSELMSNGYHDMDEEPDKQDSSPDRQDFNQEKHPESVPDKDKEDPNQDSGPDKRDSGPDKRDSGPDKRDSGPDRRDSDPDRQDSGPDKQDSGPDKRDSGPDRQDTQPQERLSGVKREWVCPPFSYRQEDALVVFCLHTANAKENTLVKYFDEYYVQLTYSTSQGNSYSFYVCFPEGCGLDIDDCSVDISEDNVVLLLKKDTLESSVEQLWSKFSVGRNPSHTTEKLFLTDSNVESVLQKVDDLRDPWELKVWSDSATASSAVKGDHLDIQITDPELRNREGKGNGGSEVATPTASTAEQSGKVPSDSGEAKINTERIKLKESTGKVATPSGATAREDNAGASAAGEIENSTETKGTGPSNPVRQTSPEIDSVPSVKVEADGSVFIRGDGDYVKNRDDVVAALKEEEAGGTDTAQAPSAGRSKVKLSNKLLYSLD